MIKDPSEFRLEAHRMADRIADYFEEITRYPVKSRVKPGEVLSLLPELPPESPEPVSGIMADFERVIMPGITHWQHPNFHAYFPANSSYASVLAEWLTAALGQQAMIWETSPAATELEERVMQWMKQMFGLPEHWTGVLQDTASASTLAALLTAREKASGYTINEEGFAANSKLRIYASSETHSSIEKAVKIAGFGRKNLVRIPVDEVFALDTAALEEAIIRDQAAGYTPCCVVATIGTTGSTAVDPIRKAGEICSRYNIWLHIDAAFAGTALVLPEMRHFADGLELADSYVFNPHKWMFTNFDASAYFVRDPEMLIRTFEILPEYLKTRTRGKVNDYRDWGVALGRRFRALKLWFVIRNYGTEGIRNTVRKHLELARWLSDQIHRSADFELLAPVNFSLVCFRYKPGHITDNDTLNQINQQLLNRVNESGSLYLSHTMLKGSYCLRMVTAQTYLEKHHLEKAWHVVLETSKTLNDERNMG